MGWFRKKRQLLVRDIAAEVINQLEGQRGWREFLPPVAFRDCVYFMTKDGQIFRMEPDGVTGQERFCKIMALH